MQVDLLSTIYLIGNNGEKLGNKTYKDAVSIADSSNLSLEKVGDRDGTPVYKLLDIGKTKYEKNKKKKDSPKQKKLKTIELRPNIEIADLNTKCDHINKFLLSGHKVRVVVKYKGREITHKDIGDEKIKLMLDKTSGSGIQEGHITMEGKNQVINLSPKKIQR